jgi:uncharacterized protein with PIN domain
VAQGFVADAMLKKLARWLRIFGARVEFADLPDNEILKLLSGRGNLALLTQDVQLDMRARRRGFRSFLVPRAPLEEQLAAVAAEFGLAIPPSPSETVCPACNGLLAAVGREEARGEVPERALAGNERFWRCAGCGKAFWEGTHWKGISRTAERARLLLGERKNEKEAGKR